MSAVDPFGHQDRAWPPHALVSSTLVGADAAQSEEVAMKADSS